jgi:pyruvate/2-oxoglutarate dehydrogenase complex dihydrolipoamide acyltransferase (E2) component
MFGKLFVAFSLASLAVAPAPLPYVVSAGDQAAVAAPAPVGDTEAQPAVAPTPAPAATPATPSMPAVAPVPQTAPAPAAPPTTPAPATPRAPRAPAVPRTPETAPTPAVAPTPPPPPRPLGQLANVQVEVVVIDQGPGEAPNRQAISAVAADRESASVRNSPDLRGGRNISLDIRPVIAEGSRVRLNLGLEYWLQSMAAEEPSADDRKQSFPQVRLTQNVVLESGKPLVISQSTAPGTQRTVTVEVKATVLR